jgi:hypothetical protein
MGYDLREHLALFYAGIHLPGQLAFSYDEMSPEYRDWDTLFADNQASV